ncbi:hypothetical protein AAHC03_016976 [Spirometra sp. Aus1]
MCSRLASIYRPLRFACQLPTAVAPVPFRLHHTETAQDNLNRCHEVIAPNEKHLSWEKFTKISTTTSPIVIDVRGKAELLETGWLSGAYNVPLDELFFGFLLPDDEFELKFGFKKPQPSQVVMLYCKTHRRSRKAQKLLEFLGFSRCLTIEGGIEDLLREIKKPG